MLFRVDWVTRKAANGGHESSAYLRLRTSRAIPLLSNGSRSDSKRRFMGILVPQTMPNELNGVLRG